MNSRIARASLSARFWFGIRTRHNSSCACTAGSFEIIGSGLVIKFIIHSGVLRFVTPDHPGPTRRSVVSLWQDTHLTWAIFSPSAAIVASSVALTPTFSDDHLPSPRLGSYSSGFLVVPVDSSFDGVESTCSSVFFSPAQAKNNVNRLKMIIVFFIVNGFTNVFR